ncbi:hypothetical protein FisN_2Lh264 [Fistulifera solaris]|uniref:Carbohydrate kinase FGGY N-terminal domain-containing protein n=1 Tax=Fistulifera solaris TaxID=1519565 RepID=A0A1Z5KFT4_FISSO|nr:hypothetical protein FisN_2Lh264 [Fistulifera solaris]|eukprot:GAX24985.1 hypothetical protein FisN_2Lh264 [Fistulifera solaris]
MAAEVIIAIDIGSSSIRCSAYNELNIMASSFKTTSSVKAVSGKISIQSTGALGKTLLDLVEECLDETLEKLDNMDETVQVVAVGFACFVMNLIGTDKNGNIIGSEATMSYACSSDEVANEVDALRRELGEHKALELYKRTGAPLHSAYAMAQLRAFYRSNSDCVSKVIKWKSICSLLLDRWTARDDTPISYSEASWCGLINYGTCEYDDLVMDLLPDACRNALPKLADFDQVSILSEGISQQTSYWKRWPLLRGSRLFLGLGDGACANIGSKCTVPMHGWNISCSSRLSALSHWAVRKSQL